MTINDKIWDEKLQYDINREATKTLVSSSVKIDKYEYLTGKEILLSNKNIIIELAMFTYSPVGKAFGKQIKTMEDQGRKHVEALKAEENQQDLKSVEGTFPKEMRTNEIKDEIDEIKKWDKKINRKDWKYDIKKYVYGIQQFESVRSFGDSIFSNEIVMVEAEEDQSNQ